jgi:hypothetical protein
LKEQILHERNASIAHWKAGPTANGTWSFAAEQLLFANGILLRNGNILVSCVFENDLFEYAIEANNTLRQLRKMPINKGLDNISADGHDSVTIPAHTNNAKFAELAASYVIGGGTLSDMLHSPFNVYRVHSDGRRDLLCSHDGKTISAVSTALVYNNKLYLSQIFHNYLLAVDLDANGTAIID